MAPSLSETVPVADGIIAPVAGGGTSMTDLVWPDNFHSLLHIAYAHNYISVFKLFYSDLL